MSDSVTAAAGAGGAGACEETSPAVTVERQWKRVRGGAGEAEEWRLFTVKDETAATKTEEVAVEAGVVVSVRDLSSGVSKKIPVKETEKGVAVIARACKEFAVAEDAVVFLFKGGQLRETELVSNILAAGGVVGLVHNDKIELEWDVDHKSENVEVSEDKKKFWSHHPDYCQANNQVRATKPFPMKGVHEFKIQICGSGVGCYDSVGLVTEDFNANESSDYNRRMAQDDTGWTLELSNRNTRHMNQRKRISTIDYFPSGKVLHFSVDRDAGTYTLLSPTNNGEPALLFDNLPMGVPLYLCAQVCGHDGHPKYKIIDEHSEVETEFGDSDSEY